MQVLRVFKSQTTTAAAEQFASLKERQPTTLASLRSDMLLHCSGELDGLLQASARRLFQQKYSLSGRCHDDGDPAERSHLLEQDSCNSSELQVI